MNTVHDVASLKYIKNYILYKINIENVNRYCETPL
jgi:hypothetical protein